MLIETRDETGHTVYASVLSPGERRRITAAQKALSLSLKKHLKGISVDRQKHPLTYKLLNEI